MSNKVKNMRSWLLMLFAAISLGVSAQNVTVKGTVKDKAGETVIGASVVQKGNTGNGTITDIDGNYSLNVPSNSTLIFSYVGMTTQEVPVNGQTVVNVLMSEDTQNLEEVVVIGYGTSKAKDLTAPITMIKADEITKHATTSPMGALQGKVPGVQITNSGQPGSGPSVARAAAGPGAVAGGGGAHCPAASGRGLSLRSECSQSAVGR